MHGTFEANNAMHDCDVMICVGARFDDRVTGRLDAFSPGSKKIHIDIDASSINKNVRVDLAIIADVGHALEDAVRIWKSRQHPKPDTTEWQRRIAGWRAVGCLACNKTGFAGRTGIYELLSIDDGLRALVHRNAGEGELRTAAVRNGMQTMRDDGQRWIQAGITSVDEVVRVTRD
jgi:TPP-dependent trihydroxycyclohexane-1,2-dione (THcHDO) dehydratase